MGSFYNYFFMNLQNYLLMYFLSLLFYNIIKYQYYVPFILIIHFAVLTSIYHIFYHAVANSRYMF